MTTRSPVLGGDKRGGYNIIRNGITFASNCVLYASFQQVNLGFLLIWKSHIVILSEAELCFSENICGNIPIITTSTCTYKHSSHTFTEVVLRSGANGQME